MVKVGNAIWPERRIGALNTRHYGGITDWVMLYRIKFESAGKIEFETHGRLYGYRCGVTEIFGCNYELARKALAEASGAYTGTDEWERRWAVISYSFED